MVVFCSSRGRRLRGGLFAAIAAAALSVAGCDNDGPYVPTGSGAGGSGAAASTGGSGTGGTAATGGSGGSTSATGGSGTGGSGAGGSSTGGSGTGGSGTGGSSSGTGGTSMTGSGGSGGAMAQMVPDFSLIDANTNSMTSGQPVSPRDYLMRVSAWYFGHST